MANINSDNWLKGTLGRRIKTDADFSTQEERMPVILKRSMMVSKVANKSMTFNRENPEHTYIYDNHVAVKKAGYPVQRILLYCFGNDIRQFAKSMGVTTRSIYNWLAGTKPSEENLSFMVAKFGVRRQFLETGEGEMFS